MKDRPGNNGLYETVWKLSHYTWTRTGTDTYCYPLFGARLGPGSAQCEYTIRKIPVGRGGSEVGGESQKSLNWSNSLYGFGK